MSSIINPNQYGLHSKTVLRKIDDNHIGIVKKIKSRIISTDAKKIIDQVNTIRSIDSSKKISLISTGNICSKSKVLLNNQHVDIIIE